jgi:hypothetical protein
MVLLAREFPNYRFLYKPFHYQQDTPAVRLAKDKDSNCKVVRYTGLLDLMPKSDLILLDFPSTALLQAATTDRPMIVLVDARFLRMEPEALRLLRRRAWVGESLDEFMTLAVQFLKKGDFSRLNAPDDEFLQRFGTHRQDGLSAERALDALLSKKKVAAYAR